MKLNANDMVRDADLWDKRELGASDEHVRRASPDEMAEINKALTMQAISIRLQQDLISDLKEIASGYGIGYQPMIRDLLKKFVLAEKKIQLQRKIEQLTQEQQSSDDALPIDISFLENRKQA